MWHCTAPPENSCQDHLQGPCPTTRVAPMNNPTVTCSNSVGATRLSGGLHSYLQNVDIACAIAVGVYQLVAGRQVQSSNPGKAKASVSILVLLVALLGTPPFWRHFPSLVSHSQTQLLSPMPWTPGSALSSTLSMTLSLGLLLMKHRSQGGHLSLGMAHPWCYVNSGASQRHQVTKFPA